MSDVLSSGITLSVAIKAATVSLFLTVILGTPLIRLKDVWDWYPGMGPDTVPYYTGCPAGTLLGDDSRC